MSHIFLLGRTPLLSLAELYSVIPDETRFQVCHNDFALIDGELPDEAQLFLDRLGGTMKIYEVMEQVSDFSLKELARLVKLEVTRSKARDFALDYFHLPGHSVQKDGLVVKRMLSDEQVKTRFVMPKDEHLSTAVSQNKSQVELAVFVIDGGYCYTRLRAVQHIAAYSRRDYNKPGKDAAAGMLPPKLAQMMINISGVHAGQTLFDPFMGSGTIMIESLLLGCKVVGNDKSQKSIRMTEKNITTLLNNPAHDRYELINADIQNVKGQLPADITIDAIVTEGSLGPPMLSAPTVDEADKILSGLTNMYKALFNLASEQLASGHRLVLTMPAIHTGGRTRFIPQETIDDLMKGHFKVASPLPTSFFERFKFPPMKRNTILYRRPDQIVGREVFVFERV